MTANATLPTIVFGALVFLSAGSAFLLTFGFMVGVWAALVSSVSTVLIMITAPNTKAATARGYLTFGAIWIIIPCILLSLWLYVMVDAATASSRGSFGIFEYAWGGMGLALSALIVPLAALIIGIVCATAGLVKLRPEA